VDQGALVQVLECLGEVADARDKGGSCWFEL
jgi:hypothetical protein